jgi:murein DD-endopeptidase MepM/ murein hydrolase activator NlpD
MNILFPELKTTWIQVNMAKVYETRKDLNMWNVRDQFILADSLVPQEGVNTYGGFGEDRTELWKDFGYPVPTIHLGIDFNNLESGQAVGSLSDGTVVDVWYHDSEFDGWGGRVVIEGTDGLFYLYGHLWHENGAGLPSIGDKIKRGQIIGVIGSESENGGWFQHLHLQIMTSEYIKKDVDWRKIDGYESHIPAGVLNPMDVINK